MCIAQKQGLTVVGCAPSGGQAEEDDNEGEYGCFVLDYVEHDLVSLDPYNTDGNLLLHCKNCKDNTCESTTQAR